MNPIKAVDSTTASVNVQQMTNDEVLQKIGELQKQLDLQKQKLANVDGISQFSMEMQAKHAETLAMIDAEETLLKNYQTFLQTGVYPDGKTQDFGAIQQALGNRETGWNDTTGKIATKHLQSDADKVGANYAGTLTLENSGYDPKNPGLSNMLAFVADDTVAAVKMKTVGKDIHAEITHKDGTKEVYVLKNMAVRPEDVVIYAGNMHDPVTIDASQVMRISDGNWGAPFGESYGLIIYGGTGNDRIVGSQGNDTIMGGVGDDKIYGVGGDDRLYGDDFNDNGASGFGAKDGNDYIVGGSGIDIIKAGGGDDVVLGANEDFVSEHENPGATELFDQPDPSSFISAPGANPQYKDGTLVLNARQLSGDLNISMPPGYTMASAEPSPDKQSLVITMAGFDVNGDAHTIRIKITGFFNPKNAFNFTFTGSNKNDMIDFSPVILPANVHMDIVGGAGDDTIFAPKSKLDSLGVDADTLGKPTYNEQDTLAVIAAKRSGKQIGGKNVSVMDWGVAPTTTDGFAWDHAQESDDHLFINSNGEIELKNADATKQPGTLNFSYPPDFKDAMLTHDGDDTLVVFIKHTVDGTEQVVVRLSGIAKDTVILAGGAPIDEIGKVSTVDGGEGYDTIYASPSSVNATAEETIKGNYPFDATIPVADNQTSTEKEQALKDKLSKVKEKLSEKMAAKEPLQKQIDTESNADIKKSLQDDMAKLIADIADLTQSEKDLDANLKALQKQTAGE